MNRPSNCLGTERASGTVKIYIAAHKHFDIDAQAPYQPLYVGSSSIPPDNRQAGWLYDDQGDNISQKNKHYCELTGLYWIWKNSPESIVGLTHYRRAFESPNDSKQMLKDYEIENILTHYDCIVAAKEPCTSSIGCNLITVAEQYRMIHSSTDLLQAREIIRTKCPGYLDAFDKAICEECSFSPCNMFICKKELMDRYCKWLFKIEKQLEKRIDYISGRDSYQQGCLALSQNDCLMPSLKRKALNAMNATSLTQLIKRPSRSIKARGLEGDRNLHARALRMPYLTE